MSNAFKIDLRTLTDTERELIALALNLLVEEADRGELGSSAAATVARTLQAYQARKPEPKRRNRKDGDRHESGTGVHATSNPEHVASAGAEGAKLDTRSTPAEQPFRHAPLCASLALADAPCDCVAIFRP